MILTATGSPIDDTKIIVGVMALAGSLIGVLISSWFSSRNRKQNNIVNAELEISKFREQWIQNLRNSLSEFQSLAMVPDGKPHSDPKFYELGTKIELMLNPEDPDYKEIHDLMYEMLRVSEGSIAEKYSKNPQFIDVSQRMLKREWERLKTDLRKNI